MLTPPKRHLNATSNATGGRLVAFGAPYEIGPRNATLPQNRTKTGRAGRAGRKLVQRLPLFDGGALAGMTLDGQPYRFREMQFRKNKNGDVLQMAVWDTVCAECEAPIEVMTLLDRFEPTRRCADCAKPGHRVSLKIGGRADA